MYYIYYNHLCERSESEEMITDYEDNDFDKASDDSDCEAISGDYDAISDDFEAEVQSGDCENECCLDIDKMCHLLLKVLVTGRRLSRNSVNTN